MIGAILAKKRIPAWFEAMNQHDLDALLKDYSDDVTMIYPGDVDGVSGIISTSQLVPTLF